MSVVIEPEQSFLAKAAQALAAGDVQAALHAASAACHEAPADKRAHYVYGQAWSGLGEHARAERAFAEAIRLDPAWLDAWINFGVALYRQGNTDAAKVAMRQVLALDPSNPVAASNLGAFMRLTGETEASETLLRGLVEQAPDTAAARLNLAADLLSEGRNAEALALLAGPPPEGPAAARHWHLQRALACLGSNDLAGCQTEVTAVEALGPVPLAVRPLLLWRLVLLHRAQGDNARARLAAAEMATALDQMGPEAVPEHTIMGHFDLAKVYASWGENRAAMQHWAAGHAILARTQPFDRRAERAQVDALIGAYSTERLSRGVQAHNTDQTPVFIVGMPRSGTTLCEQILGAHPQAHGAGERQALGQTVARLGGGVAAAAARDKAMLDTVAETYLAELHALAPGCTRIVDKMPGNYWNVGPAALLLPGARFIHCVRDPRDIGLSIFTFRFYGHHPYAHDLADLGWAIGEQMRLMTHWKHVLPAAILTVRLDDWVHRFDETLRRVLAHVRLPYDPACERFHERSERVRTVSREQVREPVNAKGLGRWHKFEPWLQPLITELTACEALNAWQ